MALNLRKLEAFAAVARYGSFSKAADATFYSQSTISEHVSSLEDELGIKVFERGGSGITLTHKGHELLVYTADILSSVAAAEYAMSDTKKAIEGTLLIEGSSVPGLAWLPTQIKNYHDQNPQVNLELRITDSCEVAAHVLERSIEVGVMGSKPDKNLTSYPVYTDTEVLLSPKGMPLPHTLDSLSQLAHLPFIWREKGSGTRRRFEDELLRAGVDPASVRVTARASDITSVISLVEANLGVAVVSKSVASHFDTTNLVITDLSDLLKCRTFYLVTASGHLLSPAAQKFVDQVVVNDATN